MKGILWMAKHWNPLGNLLNMEPFKILLDKALSNL